MIRKNKANSRFDLAIDKKQIAKSKRSQEEMVGFVLIIVLVAVIVLVFLAISLRKPAEMQEDKDVKSFLQASLLYTTGCQPRQGEVYNFKDLMLACYNNQNCISGDDACSVLNKTASDMIENSFKLGGKYTAYEFAVYIGGEDSFYLSKGNLSGSKVGSFIALPGEQNITINMRLFY